MRRGVSQTHPGLIWTKRLTQGREGQRGLIVSNTFMSPGRHSATAVNIMHFSCLLSPVYSLENRAESLAFPASQRTTGRSFGGGGSSLLQQRLILKKLD